MPRSARESPSSVNSDGNGCKEKRETLTQRRERVLGQRAFRYVENGGTQLARGSEDKRRGQVLQAQRIHRQRTLDYIEELENEIFRLRESKATVDASLEIQSTQIELLRHAQSHAKSHITTQVLIQCLSGQIAPGLFIKPFPNVELIGQERHNSVGMNGFWALNSVSPIDCQFPQFSQSSLEEFACPSPLKSLETHDALTRMLFWNFSENIAPTVVTIDGPSNGFRTFLIPLAYENELVKYAILAASANHLRFRHIKLAKLATNLHATAIEKLSSQSISDQTDDSSLTTLATIVILLVNDMMNGGNDLPILLDMARSWDAAMSDKCVPNSPFVDFLREQLGMIELYAHPLSSVKTFIGSRSNLYEVFAALEKAIKQACAIYTYHSTNDTSSNTIENLLNQLKITTLAIPNNAPGECALAWVYFLAAAESSSPLNRTFFARRLMGIYERSNLSDVTTSFNILHQIWNDHSNRKSWRDALLQMPLVFR